MRRREFLGLLSSLSVASSPAWARSTLRQSTPYSISLAQWSFHRALRGGRMEALDFPVVTKRDYGIDAVEYVNQFFFEQGGR